MKNEKKDYTVAIIVGGIIVSLLAVILGPIFIDEAFQKTASCKWLAVDWEAKDALNYYGTALAFLGTALFSALALWQNHTFKKANDAHEKMLEDMERMKNMPILCFSSCGCTGNCKFQNVLIQNVSKNIAYDVVISNLSIVDENNKILWTEKEPDEYYYIKEDNNQIMHWNNISITDIKQMFKFDVSYKDAFGTEYSFLVEGYQPTEKITQPVFRMVKK